jgi:hypothetical protein
MKSQIGLGVLSIPVAFDTLGIVPGVVILCTIACITTWSDYMVGVFKLRHRDVYGIDDAGGLMFGRIGKAFFGSAFCLCEYMTVNLKVRPYSDSPTRLGFCCWFRNAKHINCLECSVNSWYLHCCLRCCRGYCRLHAVQHPNIRSHGPTSMDWLGLHHYWQ